MNFDKTIAFIVGITLGTGGMFYTVKSDLIERDKIIAELENKTNLVPVVTVDALGICKVTQGGKTYMLIDVTNETKALDKVVQKVNKEK